MMSVENFGENNPNRCTLQFRARSRSRCSLENLSLLTLRHLKIMPHPLKPRLLPMSSASNVSAYPTVHHPVLKHLLRTMLVNGIRIKCIDLLVGRSLHVPAEQFLVAACFLLSKGLRLPFAIVGWPVISYTTHGINLSYFWNIGVCRVFMPIESLRIFWYLRPHRTFSISVGYLGSS